MLIEKKQAEQYKSLLSQIKMGKEMLILKLKNKSFTAIKVIYFKRCRY